FHVTEVQTCALPISDGAEHGVQRLKGQARSEQNVGATGLVCLKSTDRLGESRPRRKKHLGAGRQYEIRGNLPNPLDRRAQAIACDLKREQVAVGRDGVLRSEEHTTA